MLVFELASFDGDAAHKQFPSFKDGRYVGHTSGLANVRSRVLEDGVPRLAVCEDNGDAALFYCSHYSWATPTTYIRSWLRVCEFLDDTDELLSIYYEGYRNRVGQF